MTNGPQIVCCECGKMPPVRMAPPLCLNCDPELEREAAALWREENPDMSVFSVTQEMKLHYARRILWPDTERKSHE